MCNPTSADEAFMAKLAKSEDVVVHWKYSTRQIYVDLELYVGRYSEESQPLYEIPKNICTGTLFVDERGCLCKISNGVQAVECVHYSYDENRKGAFKIEPVPKLKAHFSGYTFIQVPELLRRVDEGESLTLKEWCEAARMAYGHKVEADINDGRLVLTCKGDMWPDVVVCKRPMCLSRLPENTLVRGPIAFQGVKPPVGLEVDQESLQRMDHSVRMG
ncbi:hypothetical protein SYK_11920 [Pseudodesulfovibrio nedwellii]|uniref:Uncharacterized protein n=1 Tax=Pseudodesulfovibrio nedwellii TaxID=2973072 RepID=A0ABN6S424_9BACT|nr:hypothetical protein [Pseudodesulfovibrio nedwellii]BDQ36832.1 hypothetical protein SYK_11920 [Pseudodesulfovibrio nedwellii]